MKLRNSIIMWLLTLLGFGSCSGIRHIMDDPSAPEYGVPTADFRIMGTVSDQDGNPVKGARVAISPLGDSEWARDTVYTDAKGEYAKDLEGLELFREILPDLQAKIEDIDGQDNGGYFLTKELTREDFEVEQTKDASGNWYQGGFTLKNKSTVYMEIPVEYGPPPADYVKIK